MQTWNVIYCLHDAPINSMPQLPHLGHRWGKHGSLWLKPGPIGPGKVGAFVNTVY